MARSILHLADLHLGASHDYLDHRAQERTREADAVLDRIADWIASGGTFAEEIGALLIAGDLFDSPTPPDPLVTQVIRTLRRIEDAGVRVVTLPGNHDEWTYPDGVFRRCRETWPGVLVTSPVPSLVATLEMDGWRVEIVSCAFHQGRNPAPAEWKNPFDDGPRPKGTHRIGLFHGTCDQMGEFLAGGERAFRLDLDRLASWGLEYVALGHIHKRREFPRAGCRVVYAGVIEGKGFDDPGTHELTLIGVSDEDGMEVKTLDARALGIRSREVEVISIDSVVLADAKHLEEEIGRFADPARIVRVALSGSCRFAIDAAALTRRLSPLFYHLEITGADGADAPIGDWESIASQRTLAGIFARRVIESRKGDDPRFWDEVAAAGLRALRGGKG